jgi:hypothetical protein
MNKGYCVAAYRKVLDPETVKNYAALLVPTLEKLGEKAAGEEVPQWVGVANPSRQYVSRQK